MSLTATKATGTQTATQSPQSAGSATTGTQSSSVQPGTSASALTSTDGVPLQSGSLSTIPLATQATGTTQNAQPAHHRSPVATGVSVLLFVVAIALFALLARADKTTTE